MKSSSLRTAALVGLAALVGAGGGSRLDVVNDGSGAAALPSGRGRGRASQPSQAKRRRLARRRGGGRR